MKKVFDILNRKIFYRKKFAGRLWDKHWEVFSIERMYRNYERDELLSIFLKYLPRNGKILEGGCGLGQWVYILKGKGYDVEGVDLGQQTMQKVNEYDPSLRVYTGDVTNLKYPDDYFSAYISLGVAEHFIEGVHSVLKEAYRVLKCGGVMILAVPWINPYRMIKRPWDYLKEKRQKRNPSLEFYQYAYSKKEIIRNLGQYNFRIIKTIPYDPVNTLRGFKVLDKTYRVLYALKEKKLSEENEPRGKGKERINSSPNHEDLLWERILKKAANLTLLRYLLSHQMIYICKK